MKLLEMVVMEDDRGCVLALMVRDGEIIGVCS